jgi:hypothetical protein
METKKKAALDNRGLHTARVTGCISLKKKILKDVTRQLRLFNSTKYV